MLPCYVAFRGSFNAIEFTPGILFALLSCKSQPPEHSPEPYFGGYQFIKESANHSILMLAITYTAWKHITPDFDS